MPTLAVGLTTLGFSIIISSSSSVRAGMPLPAPTEQQFLGAIKAYESSDAEIMPGDNFPRRLRLADAYMNMGRFYSDHKQFEKAPPYFEKCLAIVRKDKREAGIDYHRYLVHEISKVYHQNHDYTQAMKYVVEAENICRTVPKEKEVLHSVLTTKAEIFRAVRNYKEAETALVEAIGLWKEFAFSDQIALAELYVDMKQYDKAKAILEEAKTSKYKNNTWLSAYAKYLRATNNAQAADQLEQHVKTLKERGQYYQ